MTEKLDIRYRSSFIWCFILIVSLLATLISVFFSKNDNSNLPLNTNNYAYENSIYDIVNSSLYDSEDYGDPNDYSSESGISYYVRCYKAINYPFTKEYKERYPNSIVVRDSNGEYRYLSRNDVDRIINGEDPEYYDLTLDQVKNSNYYKTEEPEFKTSYLSNKLNIDKFDPQNVALDDNNGDVLVVRGFFEDGIINFTDTNIDKNKLDLKDTRYFVSTLKNIYKNIDTKENGIKKINFAYTFDPNSEYFKDIKSAESFNNTFYPRMLLTVALALVLITIFAIVTNYDKSKSVSFYEGISKFPIEFVIICCMLWGVALAFVSISYSEFDLYKNFGIDLGLYAKLSFVAEFILIFTGAIACFYLVHSIKGVYNEGRNSSLINNSIIAKIFMAISRSLKKSVSGIDGKVFKMADEKYNKYATFIYIVSILFGALASNIVVRFGVRLIVFILWVILVTFIFRKLKDFVISIDEINEVTSLISAGDYDVKVSDENKFTSVKDNVNAISSNLNSAIENAIKSERLKTELVTNVSHDLKTPLTSIINYSELITDDKLNKEEINKYSEIIHSKSLKLKSLIEDLFEISKVASNNVELHLENIDFKSLVSQVIGEWEDKLDEKNLDIQFRCPEEAVILNLDGDKTSRVIDNLMSNVYKYALENTRLYIDLTVDDGVKLVVKNISKYPLNISASELIERFTRGDSSRNTDGSGLGLSIASSLVNAQSGNFEIEIDGDLFKTIITF